MMDTIAKILLSPEIEIKELIYKTKQEIDNGLFCINKNTTLKILAKMWDNFKRELDIQMGLELYLDKIVVLKLAPDFTQYCLRHTYTTDLQLAGVPILL